MVLRMVRKKLECLPSTVLLANTSLSSLRTPATRRSLSSKLLRRMSWLSRIQDSGACRQLFWKNAITTREVVLARAWEVVLNTAWEVVLDRARGVVLGKAGRWC